MPDETRVREQKQVSWLRSEEWAATVVGLVLLGLVLTGVLGADVVP